MKKIVTPIVLFCMVLAMVSSCVSTKDVPYMKNADVVDLTSSRGLYDAKIMPKDLLTITVNTLNADASVLLMLEALQQQHKETLLLQ